MQRNFHVRFLGGVSYPVWQALSYATNLLGYSSMRKQITMRKLILLSIYTIFAVSCETGEFNLDNPDVEEFVNQIKSGEYDYYEKGENGEDLWLLMPNFKDHHISSLLEFSKDTTHIELFPVNPISSLPPYPNDRQYQILGECLLWTIEGIRNGTGYGSLVPYLIDTSKKEYPKSLNGEKILEVRDLYLSWWSNFKDKNWKDNSALDGSPFKWR